MNVIGLISGTSVDGIDAVLVNISGTTDDLVVDLIAANTYPYPAELRSQILAVCNGAALSMVELAELDDAIATVFAQAALAVQSGLGQNQQPAVLIGSHGQTVYHRPPQPIHPSPNSPFPASRFPFSLGYSLQLGRGALIAHLTGITTISNFRAADIAVGGHGAPLVPPVDVCLLRHPQYDRCVQNIGGIGNVTYLPAKANPTRNLALDKRHSGQSHSGIVGWDTGPGNALLDLAVQRLSGGQQSFDHNGAWAAQGSPCLELVHQWLQQEYFQQRPPKSTGRELFGPNYLDRCLQDTARYGLGDADVLATLTELTAASIAHSYRSFLPHLPDQVLVCGGGSRNQYLKQRLQANLNPATVYTTDEMGLNADYKEAIAFAVLAYWRMNQIPGNLPEVTGASQAVLLGEIHLVV
ncbi:anhydro-N-acetylmuramic acid kinase [Thermocoleostomius sinensis]|uniref:Anhydro-N-acetylmuramic acid kinase n=1 Tax=Thermocoleostomius sinensis A174 TaxID=2016057 RepID=A0A9E9CBQ3_9CYAN|nr:anhydro-N-acetylmuramic acid kinase [Thermocoleostomius sinensis]WAL62777.1 anhydro-N-acetylmuramic acid kinase [Thermocoleostomius sinensis A174]